MRCVICTLARCCSSRLSTNWDVLLLAARTIFCCFVPFQRPTLPSSSVSTGLFFFRLGLASKLRSRGICRGRGRAIWDVGAIFDVDSLPLAAMRSLRLLLPLFNAILSLSSSKPFGRASIKYGLWTPEFLSDSPSASEMKIRGALKLCSSLKWNLSISPSSNRRDEATLSAGIAATTRGAYGSGRVTGRGFCGIGRGTGGRSL